MFCQFYTLYQNDLEGLQKLKIRFKNNEIMKNYFYRIYNRLVINHLIMFVSLVSFNITAQSTLSLTEAIDIALKNNKSVKSERLKADFHQKMIETYKTIPNTTISGEFGQMNSSYFDNRFAVSQSLSMPKVYSSQKRVLSEEWQSVIIGIAIKEKELKKLVTEVYYNIGFLNAKEQILMATDTIFRNFKSKTEIRFAKGESNILEKTMAATQLSDLQIQITQLKKELAFSNAQMQLLLNSEMSFNVDQQSFLVPKSIVQNSLISHPNLSYIDQQRKLNQAVINLEKAKLLPELNFGLASMTMKGTGSDDVTYDRWKRFQSFDIGVGIPLFRKSQHARIAASELYSKVIDQEYDAEKQKLENAFQSLMYQLKSSNDQVVTFESTVLPNANIIVSTATNQFNNGEINYLDWVLLVKQSLDMRNNYVELVKARNEIIAQLSYLTE